MILNEIKKRYGLGMRTYKAGKFKDLLNPWRPVTEQEAAITQKTLDNIHNQFIKTIAKQRKMKIKQVKK